MSKCIYCHQKKGKRSCPALNGLICSGCCGEHRGRAIACPIDCPYFVDHEAYQQGRLGVAFFQERQPLYRELERVGGQKAVQLLHLCDVLTYQFFHNRPGTLDWELQAGFEYVRRLLSPIQIPGAGPSGYGDFFWKEVEAFSNQQEISKNLAVEVLDHTLNFFKTFSGQGLRSNRYYRGILGFVDQYYPALAHQIKDRSPDQGKIVLPSSPVKAAHAE
jgi:hypothetical protein